MSLGVWLVVRICCFGHAILHQVWTERENDTRGYAVHPTYVMEMDWDGVVGGILASTRRLF